MGWIGVDLDGTLAHYEEGQYPEIGEPIQPMLDRVLAWLDEGKEVRIMTARAASGPEGIKPVRVWLEELGIGHLQITCMKDSEMEELWDDRAIQVRRNTGERVGTTIPESLAQQFKWRDPKNKRPRVSDPNSFELIRSLEKQSKE
jgi:hypothetical protein